MLPVLLIAAILIPRLPALDTFATVDESTWLMRSANFYYALGQHEFDKTIYAYHPAVTTMWTGVAAMMMDFPEYRGLGSGYFVKEWQFSDFLNEQGYDPLNMLKTSRLITVGINAGLLIAIYYLLNRPFGWIPAFIATLYLAFDPFLLGHTRILAHEGMMSLLLLVSILALINFLIDPNQPRHLLILSGVVAAMAVLTKSSATIIIPFAVLLCLMDRIGKIRNDTPNFVSEIREQFKRLTIVLGTWFLLFSITFVLFWPGMWVNPSKMLSEVYGNAFSYAFQGHNLEVESEHEVTDIEDTAASPQDTFGFLKYAKDLPWHTTPITWLGLGLAAILIISRRANLPKNAKNILKLLVVFAMLFFLMMSFAKGRHTSHYIMFTYACLSIVAGLGIGLSFKKIRDWLPGKRPAIIQTTMLVGLLVIQVICAFSFFPYYFNYSNPILEQIQPGVQTTVLGYGEGLELAADYLARKPASGDLTVMSWYGIGPFSFFFPGQTENLYPSETWTPGLIERLARSDYLVIYQHHQQKRNMPAKLLQDISDVKPEHSIWLKGVEYIRIYRVSDLPEAVYTPDQSFLP